MDADLSHARLAREPESTVQHDGLLTHIPHVPGCHAGANTWGQLGQGDRKDRCSFVPTVVHMPGVVAVQCGNEHSVAITGKGTMYVWGRGDSGQLGLGDEKAKWKPTPHRHYRVVHPEKTLRRSKRSSPILRPVVPETKRQRMAEAWHPM